MNRCEIQSHPIYGMDSIKRRNVECNRYNGSCARWILRFCTTPTINEPIHKRLHTPIRSYN